MPCKLCRYVNLHDFGCQAVWATMSGQKGKRGTRLHSGFVTTYEIPALSVNRQRENAVSAIPFGTLVGEGLTDHLVKTALVNPDVPAT